MAKCETCKGSGDTENANGCTVPCRTCNGTGTAPAPAGTPEAQYNELTAIATGRLPAPACPICGKPPLRCTCPMYDPRSKPAPAAPAELAAKLRHVGSKFNARRCPGVTGEEAQAISEAAAMLTQQAADNARLTAVVEAARELVTIPGSTISVSDTATARAIVNLCDALAELDGVK